MALYSISKIGLKPLIIAPTTLLKNQWIEEIETLGIDRNDIAANIFDAPNKKCCVVTITSLENALRDDWQKLLKVIDQAQFGIKVIDEAHLHLKGVLRVDAICNIKHNWYLSATLGRSDVAEDRILNRSYTDAQRFIGSSIYKEYQHEYIHILLQDIYYYPSAKLCDKYFRYGTKGLVRSTYYNMLLNYKDGKPFLNNVLYLTKLVRSYVPYEAKTVVLIPLISACKMVVDEMKKDPYFKNLSVVSVDGSMSISEKRKNLENDIIVSTSMSMGTGVDVQNLGSIVNFDQYASGIIVEQCVGRARDRGKECWYIDVCDKVKYAKTIANWGRKRRIIMPYFPGVFSNMEQLKDIRCF